MDVGARRVTRRGQILIGGAILLVGLLVLGGLALFSTGSVREHLKKTYPRASDAEAASVAEPTDSDTPFGDASSTSATKADTGGLIYTSSKEPSQVVRDITAKWKPAERVNDPAGYFLRYRRDIVVVSPAAGGSGSRIHVDDVGRGYARWYPYIGGYWGTYSAPGGGFRGGGPGSGK